MTPAKPRAKRERILSCELTGETIVYDVNRHRAHRLNKTLSLIWKNCNGRTDAAQLVSLVRKKLSLPVDEPAIWLALKKLDRAGLLETHTEVPADIHLPSRRKVIKQLGLAGGIAAITTVLAPTPAAATTCFPPGHPCTGGPKTCCSQSCTGGICN